MSSLSEKSIKNLGDFGYYYQSKKMDIAKKIQADLRKFAQKSSSSEVEFVQKYLGSNRKFICVKSPDRDKVLRQATAELKKLPPAQVIKILDELFSTDTFEDFNFAGKLLTRLPKVREILTFSQIKKWLRRTNGWAECDCICQSLFDEKEVLSRIDEWPKKIKEFSQDKNIQLRRASLVLQVKPDRESTNPRLCQIAFQTIEKLKNEKDVLITKAISWLLRSLAAKNKKEVRKYLEFNKDSLPKIAYRETMKKIETGRK